MASARPKSPRPEALASRADLRRVEGRVERVEGKVDRVDLDMSATKKAHGEAIGEVKALAESAVKEARLAKDEATKAATETSQQTPKIDWLIGEAVFRQRTDTDRWAKIRKWSLVIALVGGILTVFATGGGIVWAVYAFLAHR